MDAAKRIVRFLYHTRNKCLPYDRSTLLNLLITAFVDSSEVLLHRLTILTQDAAVLGTLSTWENA